MQESITASLFRLLILLLLLGAIVLAGWDDPLRNRFRSKTELEAFTEPEPPEGNWMWQPGRTSIDREAYGRGAPSRWRSPRQGGTALDR